MPKTVLIADGSATIHRVVELTFADEDVTVVAAGDGDRAIEVMASSRPDLVLADIGMPRGNGYELVDYIRRQPRLAALPVLLLAGAFEQVDQARAQALGADGILTKPFDPRVLVGRVKELLAFGRGGHVMDDDDSLRDPSSPAIVADESAADDLDLPLSKSPEPPSPDADLYFEEIDRAFAALSNVSRVAPPLPNLDMAADASVPVEDDVGTTDADVPAPHVSHSVPATLPGLPQAFEALLEAERTGAAWSSRESSGVAPPAAAFDIEDLADKVARRVLEQMTDRVVRDTVTQVVLSTAERLVREEIERIKRDIK